MIVIPHSCGCVSVPLIINVMHYLFLIVFPHAKHGCCAALICILNESLMASLPCPMTLPFNNSLAVLSKENNTISLDCTSTPADYGPPAVENLPLE